MKRFFQSLTVLLFVLLLASCSRDDSVTYIIASQKGAYNSPFNHWQSFFMVKEKGANEWMVVENIYGMKYELGYEYVVKGTLMTSEDYWEQYGYIDTNADLTIEVMISKTQKTTELPEREMKFVERYLELLNSGQLPYEDIYNSEHYPPNYEDLLSQ